MEQSAIWWDIGTSKQPRNHSCWVSPGTTHQPCHTKTRNRKNVISAGPSARLLRANWECPNVSQNDGGLMVIIKHVSSTIKYAGLTIKNVSLTTEHRGVDSQTYGCNHHEIDNWGLTARNWGLTIKHIGSNIKHGDLIVTSMDLITNNRVYR